MFISVNIGTVHIFVTSERNGNDFSSYKFNSHLKFDSMTVKGGRTFITVVKYLTVFSGTRCVWGARWGCWAVRVG